MKKICMVAYTYYSLDARVIKEAQALVQQGYIVDALCLSPNGRAKFEIVNGVNLYCLPLSKYRGTTSIRYMLTYISFFVLSFLLVSKLYLRRRYDVIQFHTLPDFIIFGGIIPKICGAKLILDMHEIMPEFYMSKFGVATSHPIIRILKLLEKISVHFADAVIVINEPIKRVLLQRCARESDVTVIMNSADDRLFCYDGLPPYGSAKGFSLMYHGTLTQLYGVELGIQAVAKLKDKIPHLEFRIFGAGEDHLKKLAGELGVTHNVLFMGRVAREEIPKYMKHADVGVLPTIRDIFIDLSFSNKLAEYVCMKKPVVATRLKSTLEYFPEDAISYFESRNVDELASRILDLYVNPQKRLSQAEKAFQEYQNIRWEIMRKRYVELIKSLVGA